MANNEHPPSIHEVKFDCPHCGAFASQAWANAFGEYIRSSKAGERVPFIPGADAPAQVRQSQKVEAEARESMAFRFERMLSGRATITRQDGSHNYAIDNLFVAECFACDEVSIWLHDKLIHPATKGGPAPNADLPEEPRLDYDEARTILNLSPRGAAALLRLAIQKLCVHLGGDGKNLNKDIAALVAKGLPPLVQKSLDGVRVIGNEAVHPGAIDLRDDRDTALALFVLVNVIADQMISIPKQVEAVYEKVPPDKRAAIEARDKKRL